MWWARQDSNLQPDRYERPALTIELQAPPRAAEEAAGNGAGIVYRHDSDTAMPGWGPRTGFHNPPRLPTNLSRVIRHRTLEANNETRSDCLCRSSSAGGRRRGARWRQGHYQDQSDHDQPWDRDAGRRLPALWQCVRRNHERRRSGAVDRAAQHQGLQREHSAAGSRTSSISRWWRASLPTRPSWASGGRRPS